LDGQAKCYCRVDQFYLQEVFHDEVEVNLLDMNSLMNIANNSPESQPKNCEGYTTPIMRIPFQGWYWDDGNHNNIEILQYESFGDET